MSLVEEVERKWRASGLIDGGERLSTFIEDVGSAAAENVRSAALRRWFNGAPSQGAAWLKSICGQDFAPDGLRAEREYSFDRDSRIDLRITRGGTPVAFVEVKWASAADDQQLLRYRERIDEIGVNAPLLLVSPILHSRGNEAAVRDGIYYSKWSDLIPYIAPTTDARQIDGDLRRTLGRWEALESTTRSALRTATTTIGALTELVTHVGGDEEGPVAPLEYRALAPLMILASLADCWAAAQTAGGWRRCLATSGPRGDFQADVSPLDEGDGWFSCPPHEPHGVALSLRFHAAKPFRELEVNIGSSLRPYLEGKARDAWERGDVGRTTAVFQRASLLRERLHSELRAASIRPIGNPQTKEWWKCTHKIAFSGRDTVGDVYRHADRIAQIFLRVARVG